jgi:phospholipase/carboxylesterase
MMVMANDKEMSQTRVSRRTVLMAAAASSLGCPSPGRKTAAPTSGASPATASNEAAFGGLEVAQRGNLRDDERGGTAVVLLHGWGASGDDLVDLADVLLAGRSAGTRARFFFPVAPLPERGGGRAWWHLDAPDRPRHAGPEDVAPSTPPHPQLLRVRTAIQGVLRTVRSRFAPETLVLGGFSQGAMLSLDVAAQGEPSVDRVVALSGLLLADSLPGLAVERKQRPPVLLTHGRDDQVLPFQAGEAALKLLTRAGYEVTFRPFDGGHAIPPEVIDEMRVFLFGGA